jgi:hypothetical protein
MTDKSVYHSSSGVNKITLFTEVTHVSCTKRGRRCPIIEGNLHETSDRRRHAKTLVHSLRWILFCGLLRVHVLPPRNETTFADGSCRVKL